MIAPFFSIITVSYNAENTIKETVDSTLKQTFKNFEVIIKDCCSKDNTLEMIPKDSRVKVISEKDDGIYAAMNRAVELSSGKYLIFMNCGDLFANETVLEDVFKIAESSDDIIYGDYLAKGNLHRQKSNITKFYLYRTPICHQTMFIKRELFEVLSGYDCNYTILSDYDFTHRARKTDAKFKHIDIPICLYRGGGVSEVGEGVRIKELERKQILKKYYSCFERFKFDAILILSLRKFRIWFISRVSPKWLKDIYFKLINALT